MRELYIILISYGSVIKVHEIKAIKLLVNYVLPANAFRPIARATVGQPENNRAALARCGFSGCVLGGLAAVFARG